MSKKVYLVCCLVAAVFPLVFGHGYLIDPVNRGSVWRFDPLAPADYEDNQQFCGGITPQWNINDGKCGLCGDDYRDGIPRAHENTGKFGNGKIVAKYTKGQVIETSVLLSANHMGTFEYSICPLGNKNTLETEDCFQNLALANGNDVFKLDTKEPGTFKVDVKLPEDLTCEQCVLRWHWTTANNWGICANGTGATGCGPQETYRNCADISITP